MWKEKFSKHKKFVIGDMQTCSLIGLAQGYRIKKVFFTSSESRLCALQVSNISGIRRDFLWM